MEVSIAPGVVIQGVSSLPGLREVIGSAALPAVDGSGDNLVEEARRALEGWWTTVSRGVMDDASALHQLVMSAADARIQRDRKAAAEFGEVAASTTSTVR